MNPDHLDTEIVAAWAEGSLDPARRATAEAHAADCPRCQAVLAAMIRTEPIAAAKPAWVRAPLRWGLPLATAAVALMIWVVVSRDVQPPVPQPASRAESPRTAVEPVAQPGPGVGPKGAAAEAESPGRGAATVAAGSMRKPGAPATPTVPPADATLTRADRLPRIEERRRDAFAGARSAPPAPAGALSPVPPVVTPSERQVQSPPAQAAPRARPDVPLDTQSAATMSRRAALAESVSVTPREFASPDLTARWRLGAAGAIRHSADGGQTWTVQRSGVSVDLIAASAPSSTVCWIVGRAGVVLLSTDGASWRRLPFPVAVDLRAVAAADARTASVIAVDGRVFQTIDGGLTWEQ